MLAEDRPDLLLFGQFGIELQQSDQQPVAMNRRMPVEAAEKGGVQGAGRFHIVGVVDDVAGMVGILAVDALERQPGECRRLLLRQRRSWRCELHGKRRRCGGESREDKPGDNTSKGGNR
jgi:hypothetical protein